MKNLLVSQVDLLLLKIKSLPDNEKQLALSKIREQVASDGAQTQDQASKDQREWVVVADNTQENNGTGQKLQDCPSLAEGTYRLQEPNTVTWFYYFPNIFQTNARRRNLS